MLEKSNGVECYRGYLEKLSNRGLKWNKRLVVCTVNGDFDYYKVQKKDAEMQEVPKARFSLRGATMETTSQHCKKYSKANRHVFVLCVFVHVKKKGRAQVRLTFAAERFDKRYAWIGFLTAAISAASGKAIAVSYNKENMPQNLDKGNASAGRPRSNTLQIRSAFRMKSDNQTNNGSVAVKDVEHSVQTRLRSKSLMESVTTIDDFLQNTSPSFSQVPKSPSSSIVSAAGVDVGDCRILITGDHDGSRPCSSQLLWNQNYQSLVNQVFHGTSEQEVADKMLALQKLIEQFNQNASANAAQIIEDHLFELSQRRFKPLAHYPGQPLKEIYSIDGVVYSFTHQLPKQAKDLEQQLLEEEWKMKMSTQEMHGIEAYVHSRVSALCTALCCVIDYLGFRVLAVASLPIYDDSTLCVGNVRQDRRTTFHCEADVAAILQDAAKSINIKDHVVSMSNNVGEDTRLWATTDIRVHRCSDFNIYVTRLSGILPVDYHATTDSTRVPATSFRHAALRREFVAAHKIPLNSDAHIKLLCLKINNFDPELVISKKQKYIREKINDDLDVDSAVGFLREQLIPEFVAKLDQLSILPTAGEGLCKAMHDAGINIRYLGQIALLCRLPFVKKLALTQMAARSCKLVLSRLLRVGAREAGMTTLAGRVTLFVTELLSASEESRKYWQQVEKHIQSKYNYCVSEQSPETLTLQQQVADSLDFLNSLEACCGVTLNVATAKRLLAEARIEPSLGRMPDDLVMELIPRVKSGGKAHLVSYLAPDASDASFVRQDRRRQKALQQYQFQLKLCGQNQHMFKDDFSKKQGGLMTLKTLNKLAVLEEQAHNYKRSLKFSNQALHLLQDQPTYMTCTESMNTLMNCVSVFAKIYDANYESKTDDFLGLRKPLAPSASPVAPVMVIESMTTEEAVTGRQRSNTAPVNKGGAQNTMNSPMSPLTRERSNTIQPARDLSGIINQNSFLQTLTAWYTQVTTMMRSCDEHPLQVCLLWKFHQAFSKVDKHDSALESVETAALLTLSLFGKSHLLTWRYLSYLGFLYTQPQHATYLHNRSTRANTANVVSHVWEHLRDEAAAPRDASVADGQADSRGECWASFGPPPLQHVQRGNQIQTVTKLALREAIKTMLTTDGFSALVRQIQTRLLEQQDAARKIRMGLSEVISKLLASSRPSDYLQSLLKQTISCSCQLQARCDTCETAMVEVAAVVRLVGL